MDDIERRSDALRSPFIECDRFWFVTSTTYGTWLPGDRRGFVGPVDDGDGGYEVHNRVGTDYDADVPQLTRYANRLIDGRRVLLTADQAIAALDQFRETAQHRGWKVFAAAVMANHFHIVVGVPGDPAPSDLLRDFKSYASRTLNRRWPRPSSGTWWTEGGSTRKLRDESAVLATIRYVRDQAFPLATWVVEGL